jgi:hypothetical protein
MPCRPKAQLTDSRTTFDLGFGSGEEAVDPSSDQGG